MVVYLTRSKAISMVAEELNIYAGQLLIQGPRRVLLYHVAAILDFN